MGLTDSYAYFLPVHALYQIASIKLCHNIVQKAITATSFNLRFALNPY